ncbi:hypothetical protein [Vitiosangium sp. GDMCC 1.1324]|uniref:hypothetical protein n=1 Tax=Vitiosangium sp. (strain GDMCC 1.1324) TaxID=2138576 RepID=UPI001E2C1D9E|nr:hypothetical protein [Vitiosangium sp. GDMCC 1.1324]
MRSSMRMAPCRAASSGAWVQMLSEPAPFDVLAASRVKMAGRSIDQKLFRHIEK